MSTDAVLGVLRLDADRSGIAQAAAAVESHTNEPSLPGRIDCLRCHVTLTGHLGIGQAVVSCYESIEDLLVVCWRLCAAPLYTRLRGLPQAAGKAYTQALHARQLHQRGF